jgi:hypothetical protein
VVSGLPPVAAAMRALSSGGFVALAGDAADVAGAVGAAAGVAVGCAAVTACGEVDATTGEAAVAGGRWLAHPASVTAMLESHRVRAR